MASALRQAPLIMRSQASVPFARDLAWRLEAFGFDLAQALFRLLSVDVASGLTGAVVRLIGPLTGVQKTVDRNLRLAFPDMAPRRRYALARAQWENFGRFVAEFTMMDRLTPASGRIEVIGAEYLREIVEGGGSAVFVSGHFANWEVMPAVGLAAGIDCQITYRAANNPYVDARFIASRRKYGVRYFAPKGIDGSRELLQALKRGESVALLNDQKFNEGLPALFFGHVAMTASGPTRLALRSCGRLHPASIQRLEGATFRVVFHEPIVLERTGDRDADLAAGVAQVNAFIEARVRERPQDWFWLHRRWSDDAYAALDSSAR
ncbi:MAG: lysophospholipid acyltransferase family protein [Pseudomonadota bacterium]